MKLNKILSLVLALSMSTSVLSVATATETEGVDNGNVIYEDNFDKYTGLVGTPGSVPVRKSIFTESSEFKTESKYSKFNLLTDENDPTNKFIQIDSSYITIGKDSAYCPTSMEYLPDAELFTKENQMQKGNLKLNFSFRIDGWGEIHKDKAFFRVLSAETMNYDLTNDRFSMFCVLTMVDNGEVKCGIQLTEPTRTYHFIDKDQWYDVEMVYDLFGNNLNTKVINKSDGTVVCNFDHKIDWYDPFNYLPANEPEGSREYNAIRNVLFKTDGGLMTSVDNFKLEYYLTKPEISPKDIVVTDYRGKVAENSDAVSPAIVSIKLPFGTIMSEESTNADTVILKDSKGNKVSYVPEYNHDGYTLKFTNCMEINEKYTLYIPETVQNIMGEALGREVTYSFTTTGKKPEFMAIETVKIGESVLSDLNAVTNGAIIDVYTEYANNSEDAIDSLVSISYYDDNMLVHTESVKGETVPAGVMGANKISFTVPSEEVVDLADIDRVSVCLWESFANSIAYVESFDIGDKDEGAVELLKEGHEITYSYSESTLNIQGIVDKESKFVTVQILKQGTSFEDAVSDAAVLYRGQAFVSDGAYSVDIRYDDRQNLSSAIVSGVYPVRIFVDNTKLDIDEVYLTSYPDYVNACNALNNAANNNDFAEFKNIINNDRQKMNFAVDFAEGQTLDDELTSYFEYVKENQLDTDNEVSNTQNFKTFVASKYISSGNLNNIQDYINELSLDAKVKKLCSQMLYDAEVKAYFNGLISGKSTDSLEQFERVIKEALIFTAAMYGTGYGDLKTVLEQCGDVVGVTVPVSDTACKALMGKTFANAAAFGYAYTNALYVPVISGSSSGSSSGGGGGSKNTVSFGSADVKIEKNETPKLVPVAKEFDDIDNYEWATESILGLADRGIIDGVSENKFAPSRNVLREEFAKIIVGALDMTEYEYGTNIFEDANNDAWFTSYINIAADLGVANGIDNGCFGVGQKIKRQDMAVMIYNALLYRGVEMQSGELHFEDSNEIADYAKTAVSVLYNMGVINGISETAFAPNSFATRAEAAKMVYGVIEKLQD